MKSLHTIVEGDTKLVVPEESITSDVPPRSPAFFNPFAKISRDFSILAYNSYTKNLNERSMADALAGVGARAVRCAVEVKNLDEIYINDANVLALEMAIESSNLNCVEAKCRFSENEACRFLLEHSSKGSRFGIVDLDPFGTPAPYIDCAIRAVEHGGFLSVTATDLPVLCGIYRDISLRRYHGRSLHVEYGNEIGLRLLLGLISMVASRLEMGIEPLFVHSSRNYLRAYIKINVGSGFAERMPDKLGYIHHCFTCGERKLGMFREICDTCKKPMSFAGPLWIEHIFDTSFADEMINSASYCNVDKKCKKLLSLASEEMHQPTYYVVDKISERLRVTPPSISTIIEKLGASGFSATRTSLRPTGFRSNANYKEVLDIFRNLVS